MANHLPLRHKRISVPCPRESPMSQPSSKLVLLQPPLGRSAGAEVILSTSIKPKAATATFARRHSNARESARTLRFVSTESTDTIRRSRFWNAPHGSAVIQIKLKLKTRVFALGREVRCCGIAMRISYAEPFNDFGLADITSETM